MEITFEKVGNKYIAEFEATNDFNLHIERAEQGTLEVYQRGTSEGEYDFAWSAGVGARKVIDYDFCALVYPKYIKVVSGSEVLSASVNFNEGGGSGSGESSWICIMCGDSNDDNYNIIASAVASTLGQMTIIQGAAYMIEAVGKGHMITSISVVLNNIEGSHSSQGSIVQKGTIFSTNAGTIQINDIEDVYSIAKTSAGCSDEEVKASIKELSLDEVLINILPTIL